MATRYYLDHAQLTIFYCFRDYFCEIGVHDRVVSLAYSVAEITDTSLEYSGIVSRNYKGNHNQQRRRDHVGCHPCNDIEV